MRDGFTSRSGLSAGTVSTTSENGNAVSKASKSEWTGSHASVTIGTACTRPVERAVAAGPVDGRCFWGPCAVSSVTYGDHLDCAVRTTLNTQTAAVTLRLVDNVLVVLLPDRPIDAHPLAEAAAYATATGQAPLGFFNGLCLS